MAEYMHPTLHRRLSCTCTICFELVELIFNSPNRSMKCQMRWLYAQDLGRHSFWWYTRQHSLFPSLIHATEIKWMKRKPRNLTLFDCIHAQRAWNQDALVSSTILSTTTNTHNDTPTKKRIVREKDAWIQQHRCKTVLTIFNHSSRCLNCISLIFAFVFACLCLISTHTHTVPHTIECFLKSEIDLAEARRLEKVGRQSRNKFVSRTSLD
jgi:hypothetical protein